jgi:hypothetical protein
MTNYEFEKYIASLENVKEIIDKYGVAIIPNILNDIECENMNDGIWNTLELLTSNFDIPIKKENTDTWIEIKKLYPKHSMLIQNYSIGHAQYVWDIRQNKKIVDIFSQIWQCENEELLVSFDAVSFHMPPEITKFGWYKSHDWFHTDQSYTNTSFKCIQSFINGYDVNEGDATLSILESSHKYHQEFNDKFQINDKKDWFKLNEEQLDFYINEKKCFHRRIKCPKGSLVLWDSRTIHCGSEAMKTREKQNFRNIIYLSYEPRKNITTKNLLKKQKAFNDLRMTSHWSCKVKLFPKYPRTYGAPLYNISQLPNPILNELGLKLAGF